jgi:predicted amidohydrolase YtcJ
MTIFENATFISCENNNRIFSILIEDQGKIVHAGDCIPAEFCDIPDRIDLKGQTVVPAFGDTHMHFESFALFNATLDVRAADDFEKLSGIIKDYENSHPRENLLLGFGSSGHTVREKRLPDRNDLDKMTLKPLFLVKYDGHAGVANTSLLKKLPKTITETTGFIESSGHFFQESFYAAVNHLTKSISPYTVLKNLISGADNLAGKGIGFVHTSEGVGFFLDMDVDIMRFASRGLPVDFSIYFQTMNVNKIIRRKLPRIGGCFATALDGCFGSEDAALKEPYSNNQANKGVLFYPQQQVNDFIRKANRSNLQVALHAIGDAAVDQAITAYEEALKDFPRSDHRHIIIHADLIPLPLLERAARMGLHLAVQPAFLYWDQEPMAYLDHILGNRARKLIPLKEMIDFGMRISSGSDAPCTVPDPIMSLHAACNHPNVDQRISILDALKMHTNWSAYFTFDESKRGTLTEGKLADFVVLDKNPFDMSIEKIKDINITGTYLKGTKYQPMLKSPLDLVMKSLWK